MIIIPDALLSEVIAALRNSNQLVLADKLHRVARVVPLNERKLMEAAHVLALNEIVYKKALEGLTQYLSSNPTTEVDSDKIRHARTLLQLP